MINLNSPIVQNMISTGQFGHSNPMIQGSNNYNPYAQLQYQPQSSGNIINFGNIGYNQQQTGYTFSPVQAFDYSMQQPQSPYNQNYQYSYISQQSYQPQYNGYYNNGYATNYYGGVITPTGYEGYKKMQVEMNKTKAIIAATWFGNEVSDEELDKKLNPDNPVNKMSIEEAQSINEFNTMKYFYQLTQQPPLETNAMRTAKCIADMSSNFHNEFDNVGLVEFVKDHLWKFQREEWIREHVAVNSGRDLSKTYSNASYNDLLKLHKSSTNPYINQLLDTSRYDNNLDDMEIGLPSVLLDAEARRKQILEGRVPTFVSSESTQKAREEYFSKIMEQIYNKNNGGNNNV